MSLFKINSKPRVEKLDETNLHTYTTKQNGVV